jgi:RNA polymerase subunit RPABC4/transcription elongation factor Spt4
MSDPVQNTQESATLAPATTFAVAGRGRKQCASCKQFVGVRTQLCPCGQEFSKTDKGSTSKTTIDNTDSETASTTTSPKASGTRGRYTNRVYTPAGPCPVKLVGSDQQTVLNWANQVRAAFEKKDSFLRPEGLVYYVSHFYAHSSQDYKQAVAALKAEYSL